MGSFVTRQLALAMPLLLAAACSQSESSIPTRGRLVSLGGRPLHGSPIRITGCPDQVTIFDGSFDTSCATATYDLATTASNFGIAYLGLTRRDPVVTVPVVIAADGSCAITGTVGGRADGRQAGVVVTTTAWASRVTGLGDAPNGFFSSNGFWLDASPSATVRAFEWTGTVNGPTAFTAYVAVEVPLVSGSDATGSPSLQPIPSGALSISVDASDPATASVDLWAEWPGGEVAQLASVFSGTSVVTVPTPGVPDVAFTAVATAIEVGPTASGYTSAWRRGLPATAAPDSLALPTAAAFTAPVAESLVDHTTNFTYTAVPGAVYVLALESGVLADPDYYLVTSATTARIPDFTWAGLPPLQTSGSTTWRTVSVSAVGPFASVDAATTGPLPVEPDLWSRNRPFSMWLPSTDGFATRQRMTVQVWP